MELEEGGRKRGRGDNDVREICGNNAGIGEKRERGRNRRERKRKGKRRQEANSTNPPLPIINLSAPRKNRHPPM